MYLGRGPVPMPPPPWLRCGLQLSRPSPDRGKQWAPWCNCRLRSARVGTRLESVPWELEGLRHSPAENKRGEEVVTLFEDLGCHSTRNEFRYTGYGIIYRVSERNDLVRSDGFLILPHVPKPTCYICRHSYVTIFADTATIRHKIVQLYRESLTVSLSEIKMCVTEVSLRYPRRYVGTKMFLFILPSILVELPRGVLYFGLAPTWKLT